jgi:hypothetical protein
LTTSALSALGSAIVGKVESYLVYFKLTALIFFVVCGPVLRRYG